MAEDNFKWTDELVMEIIGLTHRAGYHKEPAKVYDRVIQFKQSKLQSQDKPQPSSIDRIEISNVVDANIIGFNNCNGYGFTSNAPISKDKFPAIKQAIEQAINGKEDDNLPMVALDILSRIWYYGNFKVETANERLLYWIMVNLGLYPTNEEQILKRPRYNKLFQMYNEWPSHTNTEKRMYTQSEVDTIRREEQANSEKLRVALDILSRIWYYGNFKIETVNERVLAGIMNELRLFPTTEVEILNRPSIQNYFEKYTNYTPTTQPKEEDKPVERPLFEEAIREVINRYSMENGSNTPDFILAGYLSKCLDAFNRAVGLRSGWYNQK